MTQNPQTASGTSFDEPDPLTSGAAALDDSTSVTDAPTAAQEMHPS